MLKLLIYYNWKIILTEFKRLRWKFLKPNSHKSYNIYAKFRLKLINNGDIAAILYQNSHLVRFNKGWEYDTFKYLEENLGLGNVVLDIGANIGVHAMFMANIVGANGTVFSFEPNKRIANLFKTNCQLNNVHNVVLTEKALGSRPGILNLTIPDLTLKDKLGGDAWGYVTEKTSEGKILDKVEVITLDSFFEENNILSLDLIKIDIEGAELNCLKGATETLKKYKPKIVFECFEEYQERFDYSTVDLLIFLQSFGYKFRQFDLFQWVAY